MNCLMTRLNGSIRESRTHLSESKRTNVIKCSSRTILWRYDARSKRSFPSLFPFTYMHILARINSTRNARNASNWLATDNNLGPSKGKARPSNCSTLSIIINSFTPSWKPSQSNRKRGLARQQYGRGSSTTASVTYSRMGAEEQNTGNQLNVGEGCWARIWRRDAKSHIKSQIICPASSAQKWLNVRSRDIRYPA